MTDLENVQHAIETSLRAWILRIVANQCRDMLRAQRARPTVPLNPRPESWELDEGSAGAPDPPSGLPSPEEETERGELRRAIQAGLAMLPEERRLAALLVDVQGLSYEEAAQAMGCSLGTVKSRLSRARRELRDYLRSAGELLPARFRQED